MTEAWLGLRSELTCHWRLWSCVVEAQGFKHLEGGWDSICHDSSFFRGEHESTAHPWPHGRSRQSPIQHPGLQNCVLPSRSGSGRSAPLALLPWALSSGICPPLESGRKLVASGHHSPYGDFVCRSIAFGSRVWEDGFEFFLILEFLRQDGHFRLFSKYLLCPYCVLGTVLSVQWTRQATVPVLWELVFQLHLSLCPAPRRQPAAAWKDLEAEPGQSSRAPVLFSTHAKRPLGIWPFSRTETVSILEVFKKKKDHRYVYGKTPCTSTVSLKHFPLNCLLWQSKQSGGPIAISVPMENKALKGKCLARSCSV